MTTVGQNQHSVYLSDDRVGKIEAIRRELSRRAGVELSKSAVIGRAIDDLFLSVCNIKDPVVASETQTTDQAA